MQDPTTAVGPGYVYIRLEVAQSHSRAIVFWRAVRQLWQVMRQWRGEYR